VRPTITASIILLLISNAANAAHAATIDVDLDQPIGDPFVDPVTILSGDETAAQDARADPPAPRPDWELQLAPYAWGSGVGGDVTVRGVDAHVSGSFLDLGQFVDMTAGGRLEGWYKRRFGFLVDSNYLRTTMEPDRGPLGATVESKLLVTDAVLMGRIGEETWTDDDDGVFADVHAGIRDVREGATLDLGQIAYSATRHWAMPTAGLTVGARAGALTLTAGGDLGGAAGNYSWNLAASAELALGEGLSVIIAYRMLHINDARDVASAMYAHDLTLHGPSLGLGFAF
jgi:hypothetical protein